MITDPIHLSRSFFSISGGILDLQQESTLKTSSQID